MAGCLANPSLTTFAAVTFHVATNGNDTWSGTVPAPNPGKSDGPLASFEGAKAAIRTLKNQTGLPQGGVEVVVHPGVYRWTNALELTGADSGTGEAPVRYRATAGGSVRIIGGSEVTGFRLVTDPSELEGLDPVARGKVYQTDLRALGLTDYGSAAGGGLELFFAEQPMPIARWPNTGFVRITEVLGKTPVDVRGTRGCVEGIFTMDADRLKRWANEPELWLHGYWFWDWSDQRQRVKSMEASTGRIELEPPYHSYGYRKGQWFYAYNARSEIDRPGEWFLDRSTGRLYFWPPQPLESNSTIASVLPTLLTLNAASHLTFQGFTLEAARDTAITIHGGDNCRIIGCTLRNVGGSAVAIVDGTRHSVIACDIYQCGAGGLSLSGGDRKTLTPAGHIADNNDIHNYGRWRPMYSAGITLSGVGNRAIHNRIHHAPHQAIGFGGNDHLIEFNEIFAVCFESNDAGAIYAGRDWTMRGTVIRHNYLHDITGFEGRGCVGVYLDDMFCGTAILGNVFCRVSSAAFIGGGRDCRVENNVFVDCQPALHVDARALGWAKYHADEWVAEGRDKGTLSGIAYNRPPYSERYPELVTILAEEPWAPRGNVVARNLSVGGRWDDIEAKARPMLQFQDNLVDVDPKFADRAGRDFRLQPDSPAWKLGFQRIPIEQIGLYQDVCRPQIPAISSATP